MARPWCETHLISCTKEYTFRGQGTDNILLGPKDVLPWVWQFVLLSKGLDNVHPNTSDGWGVCPPTRRQEVTRKQHTMTGQQQKAKIVMREREKLSSRQSTREREKLSSRQSMREREREVKLKTKHLICNMNFFEIRFSVTRMYMFAQVFEARVNPYHPPLHHHPLDASYDSVVEELHPS